MIVGELNEDVQADKKDRKYQYKINAALSYGLLKNKVISIFYNQKDSEQLIDELKKVFKKHLIPIRPNRKEPRNNNKYKRRIKPKVPKNQRDTF